MVIAKALVSHLKDGISSVRRAKSNMVTGADELLTSAGKSPFSFDLGGGLRDSVALCDMARSLAAEMSKGEPKSSERAEAMAHSIGTFMADRRVAVQTTLDCARVDGDFLRLVAIADKARDNRNWSEAESYYQSALQLYPFHRGFKVQYAHALKEQGKFVEAEQCYREAYALGEISDDLLQHLQFVATQSGRTTNSSTLAYIEVYWNNCASDRPLAAPPVWSDIRTLGDLFIDRAAWSQSEICDFLDQCPRQADVVAQFMKRPEFLQRNRDLLTLIAETGDARK